MPILLFPQHLPYFNPLPRKEGDGKLRMACICRKHFNPLPRKEGDNLVSKFRLSLINFNPLPRKEGDAGSDGGDNNAQSDFNPLPRNEGDKRGADAGTGKKFQSTPS